MRSTARHAFGESRVDVVDSRVALCTTTALSFITNLFRTPACSDSRAVNAKSARCLFSRLEIVHRMNPSDEYSVTFQIKLAFLKNDLPVALTTRDDVLAIASETSCRPRNSMIVYRNRGFDRFIFATQTSYS